MKVGICGYVTNAGGTNDRVSPMGSRGRVPVEDVAGDK